MDNDKENARDASHTTGPITIVTTQLLYNRSQLATW